MIDLQDDMRRVIRVYFVDEVVSDCAITLSAAIRTWRGGALFITFPPSNMHALPLHVI